MIEVKRVEQKESMSIEDAITQLKYDKSMCLFDPLTGAEYFLNDHNRRSYKALEMAIKSLEAWEKLRTEIMAIGNWRNESEISDNGVKDCLAIIDRHIAEIRGD